MVLQVIAFVIVGEHSVRLVDVGKSLGLRGGLVGDLWFLIMVNSSIWSVHLFGHLLCLVFGKRARRGL